MDKNKIKRKFKKGLLLSGFGIVLIFVLTALFLQYGSYSEGYRAGIVMKLSKKGYIYKTYEGELNVEGINSSGGSGISSVWEFSVNSSQQDVINILNEVALNKERVKLYYEEKFIKFFWNGDTKYIVTKVERIAP
ncbi:MAG: hypothetical protein H7A23_10280 [Leptospiraceae bacterium]|nr:hypothetical protein [Leptospiraceae bacterium]MCP5494930.1 hypothetical protein [Leptospiraceae bacterium]